jgi:hypothetical protein
MDHANSRRDRPELRNQLLRQRRTLVFAATSVRVRYYLVRSPYFDGHSVLGHTSVASGSSSPGPFVSEPLFLLCALKS